MKSNHRKTRYFAFERLVKMNSESYGAYKNWVKEKRKFSPLTHQSNNNTKNLHEI